MSEPRGVVLSGCLFVAKLYQRQNFHLHPRMVSDCSISADTLDLWLPLMWYKVIICFFCMFQENLPTHSAEPARSGDVLHNFTCFNDIKNLKWFINAMIGWKVRQLKVLNFNLIDFAYRWSSVQYFYRNMTN